MDAEAEHGLHVVMLPWLAMGHLIPFLELSKHLAQRGIQISFVSTPRNNKRVQPRIPTNLSPLIHLVDLPLPRLHNLPENAEATVDIPIRKSHYLHKAFDGLEAPFANFLQRSSPNWIIYDFSAHWLPPLAAKHRVPCAYLSLFSAASVAFFGPPSVLMGHSTQAWEFSVDGLTMAPKWFPLPSQIFFRRYEMERTLNVIKESPPDASGGRRLGAAIEGCDVALVRSCSLFEPEMLNFVEKEIYQKPTIPIGAIPPCTIHQEGMLLEVDDDDDEEEWVEISEWLDKMKPDSVVYVAIGSEASLNQEEINELALGLELSELPFFWVLRKAVDDEGDKVELPDGFTGRTMGRGLVWEGWAPQVKILAHPSIGGFLTHCGWNSTIEGLVFGRALILFPCIWEQGLNARLMESKKLGVEIEREERDGSFTRGSVAKALRMVMVEEEGEDVRRNAREMKDSIFGNKELHNRYMDTLVKYLKDHKRKDESHGYE